MPSSFIACLYLNGHELNVSCLTGTVVLDEKLMAAFCEKGRMVINGPLTAPLKSAHLATPGAIPGLYANTCIRAWVSPACVGL